MARPGRSIGALIMVVLLVGVGLVGVDRIVHGYAEKRVADELQSGLALADTPEVDIEGVPFLTQLARSTFSEVLITADEIAVRDTEDEPVLTLTTVRATLTDVVASDGYRTMVAGQVRGTAAADWAEISRVTQVEAAFGGTDASGRGRVALTYRTTLMGQELTADISGRPVIEEGELTFAEVEVDVAGIEIPRSVSDELIGRLLAPIPLPLPLGLRAEGLTVDEHGAAVEISGQDVPLTDG